METVTFKLKPDVDRSNFEAAARAVNAFVRDRDGFVARRLSCSSDGLWTEQIEWQSMAAAKGAAAAIGTAPGNAPFLEAIDMASVTVWRGEIALAVN
ncbi:hypothetical protein [Vannielia litorea]|uniref:hypothetical protein n=1 Tax=Vannielia litorea TaxID=1217970 RepID=UPI001FD3D63F|nr:hypothetical protein [Vannielia litorea]